MEKKKNDSVSNLEHKFNLKLTVYEFSNHIVEWPKERSNPYLVRISILPVFVFCVISSLG